MNDSRSYPGWEGWNLDIDQRAVEEDAEDDIIRDALECIYTMRGAYIATKDATYERHREELAEVERVIAALEAELGI